MHFGKTKGGGALARWALCYLYPCLKQDSGTRVNAWCEGTWQCHYINWQPLQLNYALLCTWWEPLHWQLTSKAQNGNLSCIAEVPCKQTGNSCTLHTTTHYYTTLHHWAGLNECDHSSLMPGTPRIHTFSQTTLTINLIQEDWNPPPMFCKQTIIAITLTSKNWRMK